MTNYLLELLHLPATVKAWMCPRNFYLQMSPFETLLYIMCFVGIPDMTRHGSGKSAVTEVMLQMLPIRNQINLVIRRRNNLESGLVDQSESVRYY